MVDFGFVISDSISLKVPPFLFRAAKNFCHQETYKQKINQALKKLSDVINDSIIAYDSATSIRLLDSRTEISIRSSSDSELFSKGVSASQYYRVARQYYDNKQYIEAYDLCQKAYIKRLQLTDEGKIETLRIQGLLTR